MSWSDTVTMSEIKLKREQAVQSETNLNGSNNFSLKMFWNEWVRCIGMHFFIFLLTLFMLILRPSFFGKFCLLFSILYTAK